MLSLLRSPRHSPGLSVCECGAPGCYPLLCLPCSPPLRVRPSRFICANVGLQGLLVLRLPPSSSHTLPVSVPPRPHESSPPRCPSPPLLPVDECLFCISLVLDPLAVRFSISSGCARRRSVSTYAAILVLSACSLYITNKPKY